MVGGPSPVPRPARARGAPPGQCVASRSDRPAVPPVSRAAGPPPCILSLTSESPLVARLSEEATVITWLRSARIQDGKFEEAFGWAVEVAEYVNETVEGPAVEVRRNIGGPMYQVHWVVHYDSLAHYEEVMGRLGGGRRVFGAGRRSSGRGTLHRHQRFGLPLPDRLVAGSAASPGRTGRTVRWPASPAGLPRRSPSSRGDAAGRRTRGQPPSAGPREQGSRPRPA